MAEEKLVDKMDGGTDRQIAGYVRELDSLNYINPSTDPKERKNLPEDRNTKVNKAQTGLETVIEKSAGGETAIIGDRGTADKVIDAIVAQGTNLPDEKKQPKEREQAIQDYLQQAGVNYSELLRTAVGLKGGIKIDQLPDGHALKTLISYIAAKKVKEEDRVRFLQRQIVVVGTNRPSSVADAFNRTAGTNLDRRYATPQESLSAYNAKLQAKAAEYRANDPNPVYNKKAA